VLEVRKRGREQVKRMTCEVDQGRTRGIGCGFQTNQ